MKRLSIEDLQLGPRLGGGTVGEVYAGTLKSTGQEVAVKFLMAAVSDDKLIRARFEREMLILEKLDHPNILRYYGGGRHSGRLFYAMERVHGGTVKELLEKYQRLSWREVASIARQVCSGLQHAHNHGIIHRDLKPSNLFVDVAGHIKLGDFGIARDTHAADITHQGLTVGTHAYMSPEQITAAESISGKADLYSLGCLLFELLTGQKPFSGANFAVLFEQHLHQPPPQAKELVSDCPQKLSDEIARLMAKQPEARPFNARAVQGVMIQLLNDADEDADDFARPAQVDSRGGVQPATVGRHRSDVAAASVIDPGMALLARKLHPGEQRSVSWLVLIVLGLLAGGLIFATALWNR